MVQLITGKEARRSPDEVAVRIVEGALGPVARDEHEARIVIRVANPRLSQAISRSITRALTLAIPAPFEPPRVVHFRTERRLRELEAKGSITGAIAIVRVTSANRRKLVAYVERARFAGALGIQLVWDGSEPPRDLTEPHVFAALEMARASSGLAPVILAPTATLLEILKLTARSRAGRNVAKSPVPVSHRHPALSPEEDER